MAKSDVVKFNKFINGLLKKFQTVSQTLLPDYIPSSYVESGSLFSDAFVVNNSVIKIFNRQDHVEAIKRCFRGNQKILAPIDDDVYDLMKETAQKHSNCNNAFWLNLTPLAKDKNFYYMAGTHSGVMEMYKMKTLAFDPLEENKCPLLNVNENKITFEDCTTKHCVICAEMNKGFESKIRTAQQLEVQLRETLNQLRDLQFDIPRSDLSCEVTGEEEVVKFPSLKFDPPLSTMAEFALYVSHIITKLNIFSVVLSNIRNQATLHASFLTENNDFLCITSPTIVAPSNNTVPNLDYLEKIISALRPSFTDNLFTFSLTDLVIGSCTLISFVITVIVVKKKKLVAGPRVRFRTRTEDVEQQERSPESTPGPEDDY